MDDLIDILESFNRKERFFLISHALNGPQGKPVFTLSGDFRQELEDKVEICIPVKDVFVAMDYHLDWVAASCALNDAGKDSGKLPNEYENRSTVINGNQEDIDLLVAYSLGKLHHLIFVEAKAYSKWDNKQLRSKANRLREIFGDDGTNYRGVKPYFCLMGPEKPNLKWDSFPKWMKPDGTPKWLNLCLPIAPRRKVKRLDKRGKNVYQRFQVSRSKGKA